MNIAVRYYTRSGNTKKLAEAVADEEFHSRGEFGPVHKGRPNEKDLAEVADFAKNISVCR